MYYIPAAAYPPMCGGRRIRPLVLVAVVERAQVPPACWPTAVPSTYSQMAPTPRLCCTWLHGRHSICMADGDRYINVGLINLFHEAF